MDTKTPIIDQARFVANKVDDPENRGRMAQLFEEYNGQSEAPAADRVLDLLTIALFVAGALVLCPLVMQLLFALFDLTAAHLR